MAEAVYTTFASTVMMRTSVVTARMSTHPVGSARPRRVVIQEPGGPSTSGGKAARQAILLAYGEEAAVCGWVDFVANHCEMRDFQSMSASYKARFRKPFDVTKQEYIAFLGELGDCLREFDTKLVTIATEVPEGATASDDDEDEAPAPRRAKPSAKSNAAGGGGAMKTVAIIGGALVLGMGLMFALLKLLDGNT